MTDRGRGQPTTRPATQQTARPPWWRVLSVSLAVAALVLWGFAGWTWWVAVPLVGGLIVVRLALGLVPPLWRQWASNRAVAVLALVVVLWLLTLVSLPALGAAAGVAGLVLVWQLRHAPWPRWARWAVAGTSAALVVGCGLAVWLTWLADADRREANERRDREQQVADLLPDTPNEALSRLVSNLAYDDAFWVCAMFSPQGQRQFADAVGTMDCDSAVHALHRQIQPDKTGVYGGAQVRAEDIQRLEGKSVAYVDACKLFVLDNFDYITPSGPQLGVLTLELEPKYRLGYLITGYTPCGKPVPGRPPPTTQPPAALPSYPPAIASLLTEAIATRDAHVCVYFTDRGRAQLATAVSTDTCERAIEVLATKVIDPTVYANPSGATTNTNADGTATVNACQLTWTEWGQETGTAPGPQLGHLVLTHPQPDDPGYLIDDVRPC